MKRSGRLKSKPHDIKYLIDRQKQREDDEKFYTELWSKRGPYSELSGAFLGTEVNKACIHHIVAKAGWNEGRYIEQNCILLTIDEHSNVENDPTRYPEISRRKMEIKEKYGIN